MAYKHGPNKKAMSLADQGVLNHYANLIRKYRSLSPMTRLEFCKSVDISNSQLSAWESGRAEPRLHSMLKICEVLDIPLEELLFNVDSKEISADEARTLKLLREVPDSIRKSLFELIQSIIYFASNGIKSVYTTIDSNQDFPDPVFQESGEELGQVFFVHNTTNDSAVPSEAMPVDTMEEPIKRKKGRPRKDSQTEEQTEKKKRGRPRKYPLLAADTTIEKRKRGRPRKNPATTADTAVEIKKRGRPRKNPLPSPEEPIIKKKRGRPRKTPDNTSSAE